MTECRRLDREAFHLRQVAELRHVEIQVMPINREDHAAVMGSFRLLKLQGGKALGHTESQLYDRVISDPKHVQVVDLRYGMIRAQALSPHDSLAFIEKVLGEET
ncbi:Scr1 family TA system antitoxin-like transcriptional regulator [Streptomyces sp. NPDC058741]|uniref:Scr1 family TA system antitoxin-like transcriptional regulator n=1 Tax=Streptomyces sp. NPDC058741 TaxID=3346620 RepID=UPI0036A52E27